MASPPFTLDRPYHDLSTYAGRVRHFVDLVDPRQLFVRDAQLERAKALLQDFREGRSSAPAADLWQARRTVEATLHPDTGEKVPLAFRACAFAPSNIPIAAGMLLSTPTVGNAILWQWVNQSYNAGFNFMNRPIEKGGDDSGAYSAIATAYCSATAVSCTIAVSLGQFVKRATVGEWYRPAVLRGIGIGVPWVAVAGAGVFNVVAMRCSELSDGIPIFPPGDDTGAEPLGKSCAAARAALAQCSLSRVVLPMPCLLFPPLVIPAARRALPGVAASKLGGAAIDLAVLTVCIAAAFPFAIALFPQRSTLHTASLDAGLREKVAEQGYQTVVYNKGL